MKGMCQQFETDLMQNAEIIQIVHSKFHDFQHFQTSDYSGCFVEPIRARPMCCITWLNSSIKKERKKEFISLMEIVYK